VAEIHAEVTSNDTDNIVQVDDPAASPPVPELPAPSTDANTLLSAVVATSNEAAFDVIFACRLNHICQSVEPR